MHGKIGHLVPIGADDEQVLFRLLPDIECLWTIILLDTRTPAVPRSFDRALAGGVSKPDFWTAKRMQSGSRATTTEFVRFRFDAAIR